MIRGNIAIPSAKSLKRSRPKRRCGLPADMPVIFENVRSPAEIAKAKRIARLPIWRASIVRRRRARKGRLEIATQRALIEQLVQKCSQPRALSRNRSTCGRARSLRHIAAMWSRSGSDTNSAARISVVVCRADSWIGSVVRSTNADRRKLARDLLSDVLIRQSFPSLRLSCLPRRPWPTSRAGPREHDDPVIDANVLQREPHGGLSACDIVGPVIDALLLRLPCIAFALLRCHRVALPVLPALRRSRGGGECTSRHGFCQRSRQAIAGPQM
jgi:hypothetical protein